MFSLRRAFSALAISMAVLPCAAHAATFVVDRSDDADVSVCSVAANDCTLRGAINKANATAGDDAITFDASVFATEQTLSFYQSQLPKIDSNLTITGPAARLRLSGNATIFQISTGNTVTLSKLNASSAGTIGNAGTLNIINCTISSFAASVGISNSGTLTLKNSVITGNNQGLSNFGTATVEGSLFTANKYGIINNKILVMRNSTVAANGFAFRFKVGDITMDSCTVLDQNSEVGGFSYDKISNSMVRAANRYFGAGGGNNLFGDEINRAGLDPDGLKDNGGPTLTIALLPGSAAINTGQTSLTTDQRGVARPQGNAADVGAYEADTASEDLRLFVTTLGDVVSPTDDENSLREAMLYANSKPGADIITFADDVRGSFTVSPQLPTITEDLTIQGPGARDLVISGNNRNRIFAVAKGINATISGLGLASSAAGGVSPTLDSTGGAISNAGTLLVKACEIRSNVASDGGGIYNSGALTVKDTLFANNNGANSGGAISNANGSVVLRNCTLSGNRSSGRTSGSSGGGAIDSYGANATVSLDFCTVAGNTAPNVAGGVRSGLWIEGGTLSLHNSIVAGNGPQDIQLAGGTLTSAGYNLVGNPNGASGLTDTDIIGADPLLDSLQNKGGAVDTRALPSNSPAVNAADPATSQGTDGRGPGFSRIVDGRADIGSFELVASIPTTDDLSLAVISGQKGKFELSGTTLVGGGLSYRITQQPSGGGTTGGAYIFRDSNGESVLYYRSSADFSGTDTLKLVAVDRDGRQSKEATITINVTAIANPSVADVSGSALSGQTISLSLSGTDPAGGGLKYYVTQKPGGGGTTGGAYVAQVKGQWRLFYRSSLDFSGKDKVKFVAVDFYGRKSNEATATITVTAPLAPPVANNVSGSALPAQKISIVLSGTDPAGGGLTYGITQKPGGGGTTGGAYIFRDNNGISRLYYRSSANFSGRDTVKFVAIDKNGRKSAEATATITVQASAASGAGSGGSS